MVYAGFWRRFGAFWLDLLVLLPWFGLTYWLGKETRLFALYNFVPGLLIDLWFNVYLVKRYGGTPGKLMLKIRIAKPDGSPVGYREAFLRHIVLVVLSMPGSVACVMALMEMSDAEFLALGFRERNLRIMELVPPWYEYVRNANSFWVLSEFIVLLTNERRRALHDFIGGTVVIKMDD